MSAQHTPGPWDIDEGGLIVAGTSAVAQVYGDADFPCLEDGERDAFEGESDANAHLVAAAPDLLAATKRAAEQFEFYERQHRAKGTADADAKAEVNREIAAMCRAVIAKATGSRP